MKRVDETQFKMGFCCSSIKGLDLDTPSSPRNDHGDGRRKPLRIARFKLNDIYLATCGFDRELSVGHAVLSQVFRAKLLDGSLVIVKRAWPGDRYWNGQLALENERQILSSCKGKYLLNLVGVSDDTPERILLLEYASHGNLHDALHHDTHGLVSWPARIQIAHQIAVAIRGLHSPTTQIIHRDVKSSNVWINHSWNAKLGGFEFGLRACKRIPYIVAAKCPSNAMAAVDPDYHAVEHPHAKTDVFCFGVLLLEIISGRKAMDMNQHPPFVVDWAMPLIHKDKAILLCDPKIRMPFQNLKVVLDMARIAARCVNTVSSRRPTMAEVAEELKMLSLKAPLVAQQGSERGMKRSNMANTAVVHPKDVKGLSSMVEKDHQALVRAGTSSHHCHAKPAPTSRCDRPSVLFGLMAPKIIPPQSYLGVLEDVIAKRQREPLLPPHLRHEFT